MEKTTQPYLDEGHTAGMPDSTDDSRQKGDRRRIMRELPPHRRNWADCISIAAFILAVMMACYILYQLGRNLGTEIGYLTMDGAVRNDGGEWEEVKDFLVDAGMGF